MGSSRSPDIVDDAHLGLKRTLKELLAKLFNQRNSTAARVRAGDATSEKGRFDGFGVLTGFEKRSMGRGLRSC